MFYRERQEPLGRAPGATAINATNGGPSAGCSLTGGGISDSRPQFRFTQVVLKLLLKAH
jgi:hypothetical protein